MENGKVQKVVKATRKKNKAGALIIPGVKTHDQAIVIRQVVLTQDKTDRLVEQNKDPETDDI